MDSIDYSSQNEAISIINNTAIFSGLGIHEQHMLVNKCVLIERGNDEIVVEQGDVGDRLYMIVRGSVLVTKKTASGEWTHINTLGAGDVFGEIAILRRFPRTARITTQTRCTFLTINAQDFLEIYQYFPPQSRDNIQLVIAKRLEQLPK